MKTRRRPNRKARRNPRNNGKGGNGQGKINKLTLFKRLPLVKTELVRQITLSVPVYANLFAATPATAYSFNSSPLLSAVLYYNILGNLSIDPEFLRFAIDYNFFKLTNIGFRINCTFQPGKYLTDVPDLYFNSQVLNSTSSLTKESVARADNSFPVKVNNVGTTAAFVSYSLPAMLQGINGYTLGSSVWINTNSTAWTNFSLYMVMGSLENPGFDSSIASNTSVRVAVVEILLNVQFGAPILQ